MRVTNDILNNVVISFHLTFLLTKADYFYLFINYNTIENYILIITT